ncbi:hypothetical protein JCM9279_005736 [Rhodotorula babjevae]
MSDRLGDDVLLLILDHFSHLAVGDRDSERQATLRSAPTTFFRRWLEPSRLPVLRTICVGPLYETPTWSSPIDLDHVLARPLLHQLDYIRATPDNLNLAGPIARGVTPPVLFYMLDGIHAALPPFPFPKHIAVPPRLAASSSIQPILNWLTVAIERAPKPPADEPAALVILSREVLATAAASAPVAQSVQALEAACQWREVRLVWLAGECRDLEAYGEVVVERDFGIEVFVRHALEFRPARGAAR